MINLILLFILWVAHTSMMLNSESNSVVWMNGILFGILWVKFLLVIYRYMRSL